MESFSNDICLNRNAQEKKQKFDLGVLLTAKNVPVARKNKNTKIDV